MKKILIFALFVLAFAFTVSAAQLQFVNGNNGAFSQGETILAEATGNFLSPVTSSNVVFYRDGHVQVPAITGVLDNNGDFYIYGILGNYSYENYTLALVNVKYMKGAQISQDNIKENFTVGNSTADFSINPGVVSSNKSFSFKIQDLQDGPITVGISVPSGILSNDGTSLNLKSGQIENISFSPTSSAPSFGMINFTSLQTEYDAPFMIPGGQYSAPIENYFMGFEPSAVSVSMPTSSNTQRIIYLQNKGKTEIDNITLNVSDALSPYVNVSPETIDYLSPNSTQKITITVLSGTNANTFQGNILASSENASASLSFVTTFIQNYIPQNSTNITNTNSSNYTNSTNSTNSTILTKCSDLEGVICGAGQVCAGNTTETADGTCCLTVCQAASSGSSSSTSKVIGWSLVLVIVLLIFWFFKKRYGKVKNKVNFEKIAKIRK